MSEAEVNSPCIGNCCLDNRDICVGCFRSLDEIKQWHGADDGEKKHILANAEQRKQDSNSSNGH